MRNVTKAFAVLSVLTLIFMTGPVYSQSYDPPIAAATDLNDETLMLFENERGAGQAIDHSFKRIAPVQSGIVSTCNDHDHPAYLLPKYRDHSEKPETPVHRRIRA